MNLAHDVPACKSSSNVKSSQCSEKLKMKTLELVESVGLISWRETKATRHQEQVCLKIKLMKE